MADALLSAAVEQLAALIEEQAKYHVNLIRGAEKEVGSLVKELNTIRNVLDDAENRRFKDKNINSWLSRLEQASYEVEDILDEWNYALLKIKMEENQPVIAKAPKKKVCSFITSSSSLWFKRTAVRHEIARKIVNVKAQLDEIFKEKDRYGFEISQPIVDPLPQSWRIQSTSLIDLGDIHGRDRDRDILVSMLIDSGGSQEESGIQIVSIVGVGGLGKTALAQLAYNHSRVENYFDLRIWVCVSDPFDLASIAKRVLECVEKGSLTNTESLDVLLKHVGESISGKRFFLVLDDVWTDDYNKWEPLKNSLRCGGAGSKILVTTRNERVAKMMGLRDSEIFRPGLLSDENCWLLLCRMALFGKDTLEFEDIGMKIAKKCKGLPLAAKTLGSLLRFKGRLEEWENVLKSEIWNMVEVEVEIFPHLLLSYKELSPTLKRCFSYCAIFPKDSIIDVESLIENWMALGYLDSNIGDMELKGQECFDVLAMRSLFQDFKKNNLGEIQSCKMHDIVHDFAKFLRKSGRVEALGLNKTTCQVCDPLLVSNVNEFCSLFVDYRTPPSLCDCLIRLRVMSLTRCGLQSSPQGIEKFIHLRRLELVGISKLECEDLKIIFQLYNLQTLVVIDCSLEDIPSEIKNLIHLRHLNLSGHERLSKLPREIGELIHLRRLDISDNGLLKELPKEIGNLIQLRSLDLSSNESLEKLPSEIGNLIQLRSLDLSNNESLEELPSEIGNLIRLKYLYLHENESLKELPESISGLKELETLCLIHCRSLCRLPEGLAQLISLHSLSVFRWGSGLSKLGLLKTLNHLCGYLQLHIRLGDDGDLKEVVEEARKAELRNKIHLEELVIQFEDYMDGEEESSRARMDVLDALQPHSNLRILGIWGYKGSKLPLGWIVSPLNQLRSVRFRFFSYLTLLPPLGSLPCLEHIYIFGMVALEIVGREFLGITGSNIQSSSNTNVTVFPKLKSLFFLRCEKWKEWEDITEEEEERTAFQIMPCLTELHLIECADLTALPNRLLRKITSLKKLDISRSVKLEQRYTKKDGPDRKCITQNNPGLQLSLE